MVSGRRFFIYLSGRGYEKIYRVVRRERVVLLERLGRQSFFSTINY